MEDFIYLHWSSLVQYDYAYTIPVGSLQHLEITVVDTATTMIPSRFLLPCWLFCCILKIGGWLLTMNAIQSKQGCDVMLLTLVVRKRTPATGS